DPIHRKAVVTAPDLGILRRLFATSRGWAKGFLGRYRLVFGAKTLQSQIKPDGAIKVLQDFNVQLKLMMAEVGVDMA
ncbi:hypothetical protein JG687_00014629, partial [Phytophthora cactorum]